MIDGRSNGKPQSTWLDVAIGSTTALTARNATSGLPRSTHHQTGAVAPVGADFVAEIGMPTARGRLVHFLKPFIVTRWIVRATYARLYRGLQRLRSAHRGDWWWPGDQLGKPAEVLRNRSPRELELGTAWPA